jgi:hypothetical protein
MKKIYFLFSLFALLLLSSCEHPNTQSVTPKKENIASGWYLYTTNADSDYPQYNYFYIDASGAIKRAGSSAYEYTGSHLERIQTQLSYSICKRNADGKTITFQRTNAPSWFIESGDTGNEETICPYVEGEYLDVLKNTTFTWPVNKNLQLWSEKENNYTCSCDKDSGYINQNNIFVVGESLSAGDYVTISMEDTLGNIYTCYVYFTTANTSADDDLDENNSDSDPSWDIGYEWWCFKEAFMGPLDCYVLYDNDGNPLRTGTNECEDFNNLYLLLTKTQATQNFTGVCYKISDYTQLPSWCFTIKNK